MTQPAFPPGLFTHRLEAEVQHPSLLSGETAHTALIFPLKQGFPKSGFGVVVFPPRSTCIIWHVQDHFHFRATEKDGREMASLWKGADPPFPHRMTKKDRPLHPAALLCMNSRPYQAVPLRSAKDLCSTVMIVNQVQTLSAHPCKIQRKIQKYIHKKQNCCLTKRGSMTALCSRCSPVVIIGSFRCYTCTPGVPMCHGLAWGEMQKYNMYKYLKCLNLSKNF